MRDALIFGAGGHASVIASMLPGRSLRFVVRDVPADPGGLAVMAEEAVFGHIDDLRGCDFYIGIGDNVVRQKIFDRLAGKGIEPAICVSAHAFVADSARLSPGVVICPGGVVMANADIGPNVIVNTLSSIDHDCVVGAHSQVTAGVTFGGGVRVGRGCFVGLKAAILPGISIGDHVTVMAGSVVTANVSDNVMVGGCPARVVRSL